MPRNRQQIPREERTGDLLAAATELFLSKGYAKTTMADISSAAGVARGNDCWYFDSKAPSSSWAHRPTRDPGSNWTHSPSSADR
ncbi:helix-turn-helix domain-containing protein [Streptomyces europaeiscabiei]|uniref:helix-turn-helix domain-containing protein n=1 Tax=Streptomyces europaeiscabiei TaxID=146819 RepID=UPI002E2DFBCE|nr:helix-turn-helix domain-containing protein [Streptomyces europaeiscabiei]